jgi:hypothetical protein
MEVTEDEQHDSLLSDIAHDLPIVHKTACLSASCQLNSPSGKIKHVVECGCLCNQANSLREQQEIVRAPMFLPC